MRGDLAGGMEKEVMKGWSQLEAVCVGRGFGFKSCSSRLVTFPAWPWSCHL